MKTAIFPGSFDPWHKGHLDTVKKALHVFDEIYVARGVNPEKGIKKDFYLSDNQLADVINKEVFGDDLKPGGYKIKVRTFSGLLVDEVKSLKVNAVIRGLRNGHDLQYEMNQQYWNEDFGLEVPIMYFISGRDVSHISSSMIRAVNKFKK